MAVQAQFPSNAAFSPDFSTSAQAANVLDGLQKLQNREQKIGHLLHSFWRPAAATGEAMQQPAGFTNAKGFSDHPQNARTCNASSSVKRCRTDQSMEPPVSLQPSVPNSAAAHCSNVFECAVPSSSGRPAGVSAASLSCSSAISPEVLVRFYQQIQEMDALFCIQNERLRLAMVESHKRYCSALLFAHKQHMAKRLCEKEAELQNASRRNAELEKKLCEISADNLFLFKLAKNNEAIVASLRTSLEQVKVQNTAATAASSVAKEGYGDSEGTPLPATDAHYVFLEREEARMAHHVTVVESTRAGEKLRCSVECKVCRDNDACVLVLPCRHLCLCKVCETAVGSCPVCYKPKDESLYVFLS